MSHDPMSCPALTLHYTLMFASLLSLEEEHNLINVLLSCPRDEAVEQWVGQAVEAGDGNADFVGIDEPRDIRAVIHQRSEQHHDVDGSEAEQEAEQNHCQQPGDPFTLLFLCGLVGLHRRADAPGGEHHQENRNYKPQDEAQHVYTSQLLREREEGVKAHRRLVVLQVRVLPRDGGGIETDHQHPNGDAHRCCSANFPQGRVLQRVDHRQVAVDGDAAEESVAGVEVGEEGVDGEHTHVTPVGPDSLPQEVQPQRQTHREGQVAQGQVEQIHPELILLSNVLPWHVEGEGVGGDGGDDDGRVDK